MVHVNRKVSSAIFEITWGKAIPRSTFAASSAGYFDRNDETDFEEMERARMKVTRVCIYHVDHDSAGKTHAITGEIFAHMMFECVCHRVSIVGGDANKLSYQNAGQAVECFLQHVNLSVLDRQNGTNFGPLFLKNSFAEQ